MAVKNFDYENFAQNLAAQASELVPQDFDDNQKQYVINTLGNFAMLSGKALAEDPALNFNEEQAVTITQIIAEWSFHKSVDIIRSGIPQQYWDGVMQKIAYTIFEVAKQTFSQGLPNDKILELIEHHVKKTYVDAITELQTKGAIDEELMEFAASQSNMDRMAQEMKEQAEAADMQQQELQPANEQMQQAAPVQNQVAEVPQSNTPSTVNPEDNRVHSKVLKLATVALLCNQMQRDRVQTILERFDVNDAESVVKFMQMQNLLEKVGTNNAMKCLMEIQAALPPNKRRTEIANEVIVNGIKKATAKWDTQQLDTILVQERIGVKRLVYNALEDTYYEPIPPKVASIVAIHLMNSV